MFRNIDFREDVSFWVGGIMAVVGLVMLAFNLFGLRQINAISDSMNKIPDVSSRISLSSGAVHGNIFAQALISADNPQVFDPVTGVGGKYISVRRQVEYFQWVERRKSRTTGYGRNKHTSYHYYYSQEWTDSPVDSSSFHDKSYCNTCKVNLHNEEFYTDNVKFGPWNASREFLDTISKGNYTELLDPNADLKPIHKDMHINGNSIYVGDRNNPEVGDMKISYFYIVEGIYSGFGDVASGSVYPLSKDSEFFFTVRPGREDRSFIINDVLTPKINPKKNFIICGAIVLGIGLIFIVLGYMNRLCCSKARPVSYNGNGLYGGNINSYGNSCYGGNINSYGNSPYGGNINSNVNSPYGGNINSYGNSLYGGNINSNVNSPYGGNINSNVNSPYGGNINRYDNGSYGGNINSNVNSPYGVNINRYDNGSYGGNINSYDNGSYGGNINSYGNGSYGGDPGAYGNDPFAKR